jgi:hypothetical protein
VGDEVNSKLVGKRQRKLKIDRVSFGPHPPRLRVRKTSCAGGVQATRTRLAWRDGHSKVQHPSRFEKSPTKALSTSRRALEASQPL